MAKPRRRIARYSTSLLVSSVVASGRRSFRVVGGRPRPLPGFCAVCMAIRRTMNSSDRGRHPRVHDHMDRARRIHPYVHPLSHDAEGIKQPWNRSHRRRCTDVQDLPLPMIQNVIPTFRYTAESPDRGCGKVHRGACCLRGSRALRRGRKRSHLAWRVPVAHMGSRAAAWEASPAAATAACGCCL
jgi:hypothetical protein